jgi:putative salt-induced outer membrane protein YdiY
MSRNDCCIDTACIDELIEYIRELDDPSGIKQPFPHRVNFELLAHSLSGMSLVEKMIAENEGLSAF